MDDAVCVGESDRLEHREGEPQPPLGREASRLGGLERNAAIVKAFDIKLNQ